MKAFLIAFLLWPVALAAQGPFDGTWVAKLDTIQFPQQPENYLLQNDDYECSTCVPKVKVKADGKDYPVPGSPYFSTVAVRVIDPDKVEITEKLAGRTVYSETDTVASGGNTLVEEMTDAATGNGKPMMATETLKRVTAAPAGASPISGSWQAEKIEGASENGTSVTYRSNGEQLEASNPNGEGYSAKFDGKEYPIRGLPGHNTVSLQRIGSDTIVETDRQDGIVHYQVRMTVAPDGKSMQVTETDNERGTQMTYTMLKK
ncbi:MAG TPA: hypothetical protein VGS27_05515 [Candidatus Sulfotelmatobacter sp.]|nr:hypothetical protein [Candidatus Sulfotelmatobacter sp.]